MKLSEHFSLAELCFSQTAARHGIDNQPPAEAIENLRKLTGYLETIRAALGNVPIRISSGYRSPALNALIKGSAANSAHTRGLAADISSDRFSPAELARAIAKMNLDLDQIILEYDAWVHIGLANKNPRRQLLSVRRGTGFVTGLG